MFSSSNYFSFFTMFTVHFCFASNLRDQFDVLSFKMVCELFVPFSLLSGKQNRFHVKYIQDIFLMRKHSLLTNKMFEWKPFPLDVSPANYWLVESRTISKQVKTICISKNERAQHIWSCLITILKIGIVLKWKHKQTL